MLKNIILTINLIVLILLSVTGAKSSALEPALQANAAYIETGLVEQTGEMLSVIVSARSAGEADD